MRAASAVLRTRESDADRCPGALRLHPAADGLVARLRLPGGIAGADVLTGIAALTDSYGDGQVAVTGRGNIQVRGVRAAAHEAVAQEAAALGLLPSPTHERVRNIVASPRPDPYGDAIETAVRALDRAVCARPRLGDLPGRFLFGVDDGSGDIAAFHPDALGRVCAPGRWWVEPGDIVVADSDLAAALVAVAEAFLDERAAQCSRAWRIAELRGGSAAVAGRVRTVFGRRTHAVPSVAAPVTDVAPTDPAAASVSSTVEVTPPLGRLTAAQLRLLAQHAGPRGIRITPWRTVLLIDPREPKALSRSASAAGLGVGDRNRWTGVSACTGRPGCADALADVHSDARAARTDGAAPAVITAHAAATATGLPVHWSGCARRCGHPPGSYADVLATASGYVVCEVHP